MIFNFTNFSFVLRVKLDVQSPRKKLTTQYKFCLMDADAKRLLGRGVGSMRTPVDKRKGDQELAKSCGRLLLMAPFIIFKSNITKTVSVNSIK